MSRALALILLLAVALVFATPVPESLTLARAKGIVAACFDFVRNSPDPIENAGKITVSIVDNAGQLKAFVSDDGAARGGLILAESKARASILFGVPSHEIGANGRSLAGGVAYKIEMFNGGITSISGTQLILDENNMVIGALAVSGYPNASYEDAVVQAGLQGVPQDVLNLTTANSTAVGLNVGIAVDMAEAAQAAAASPVSIGKPERAGRWDLPTDSSPAVVDQAASLQVFYRMDGARQGDRDLAQKKARSAVLFDSSTAALYSVAKPNASLYGIELTNDGVVLIEGGLPLRNSPDTLPLGAIGVSGTDGSDEKIAAAGIAAATNNSALPELLTETLINAVMNQTLKFAAQNHSVDSFGFAWYDAGCILKFYYRMEKTPGAVFTIAGKKAQTSCLFMASTEALSPAFRPGGPSYSVEYPLRGAAMFAGGVPLYDNAGTFLGALGVSGSNEASNDADVAQFAANLVSEYSAENLTAGIIGAPEAFNDTMGTFLTSTQAYQMLIDASRASKSAASVAVVDASKQLKMFLREDGSLLGLVDLALRLGQTVTAFGLNSETLLSSVYPDGALYGFDELLGSPMISGGVPIAIPAGPGAVVVASLDLPDASQAASAAAKNYTYTYTVPPSDSLPHRWLYVLSGLGVACAVLFAVVILLIVVWYNTRYPGYEELH